MNPFLCCSYRLKQKDAHGHHHPLHRHLQRTVHRQKYPLDLSALNEPDPLHHFPVNNSHPARWVETLLLLLAPRATKTIRHNLAILVAVVWSVTGKEMKTTLQSSAMKTIVDRSKLVMWMMMLGWLANESCSALPPNQGGKYTGFGNPACKYIIG